ncbi:alpha/beta hydrolase family protein, partial [Comamonas thiooxydans]|uniref:alpha/beta hydrolase family protein n=1 Tax=Comamonas thiooxydans TaxID=363952 RepID=UPI00209C250A
MVFIGTKMASRGWISLDRIKDKAHAQQPAALVWPPALAPESDDFCHTVKLNLAQVDKAQEEGINIDQQRRCITRAAMAEHEMAKVRHAAARKQHASQRAEQVQIEQVVDQQIASGEIALQNLMQARAGKTTQIATALLPAAHKPIQPMPTPPSQLFVPMSYRSGDLKLNAFVTPDPRDGRKQPLMVWLTGGGTNSLDDFWSEGPAANDQSASAFRKAGMAMLFPTLRGGNDNPGQREYFWGEVQDVAAAILQAAQLPYVDPARIYLG